MDFYVPAFESQIPKVLLRRTYFPDHMFFSEDAPLEVTVLLLSQLTALSLREGKSNKKKKKF